MTFDFDAHGSAFLARNLHRLRRLVTEQSDAMFEDAEIDVPSSCVSTMLLLARERPSSIAAVAAGTGYSHQLVSQRLALLERLGLVRATPNARDRRKRNIALTESGAAQAQLIAEFLQSAGAAFEDLEREIGIDLSDAVGRAAEALARRPLRARIPQTVEAT